MRYARWLVLLVGLSSAFTATSFAYGDDNEAAAQALFDQAEKDMAAGAYDKACPALVEVVRLSRGIGSMMELGRCYEAQGKLASSWASWKAAGEMAQLAQDKRAGTANAKAKELFEKLPHLTITVAPAQAALEGLTIRRDNSELGRSLWNTAIPVDSGQHKISASAPGKKPWTGTVDVPSAGTGSVLEVPVLEDLPPPPVSLVPPPSTPVAPPVQPVPMKQAEGNRTWAWAIGGGGVAALVGGVLFAIAASSAESSAHTLCPGGQCLFTAGSSKGQEANSDISQRTRDEVLTGVFGGLGVVGIAVGTIGVLGRGKSQEQARLVVLPGGLRFEASLR